MVYAYCTPCIMQRIQILILTNAAEINTEKQPHYKKKKMLLHTNALSLCGISHFKSFLPLQASQSRQQRHYADSQ